MSLPVINGLVARGATIGGLAGVGVGGGIGSLAGILTAAIRGRSKRRGALVGGLIGAPVGGLAGLIGGGLIGEVQRSRWESTQPSTNNLEDKYSQKTSPLVNAVLDNDNVTISRRQAWEQGLSDIHHTNWPQGSGRVDSTISRVNSIIRGAKEYREKNPGIFHNWPSTDDPDKQVRVRIKDHTSFMKLPTNVSSRARQSLEDREGLYIKPEPGMESSRSAVLHEMLHDTNDMRLGFFRGLTNKPTIKASEPILQAITDGYFAPMEEVGGFRARTGMDERAVKRIFRESGHLNLETVPVLGEVRLALENTGVNTSNPEQVKHTLLREDIEDVKGFGSRVRSFIKSIKENNAIEEVSKILPGVARSGQKHLGNHV